MMFKKRFLMSPEDDENAPGGEEETEDPGTEEEETPEDDDSESPDDEENDEDPPELSAHAAEFSKLTSDQQKAVINNATAFEQIRQDPEFEDFFRAVVARAAGIQVPGKKVENDDNVEDIDDLSDLSDKDVLDKYVTSKVSEQLGEIRELLKPLVSNFSKQQLDGIREEFPDLDELMPKVTAYRAANPWAKSAPLGEVLKIVTAGDENRVIDKVKNKKTAGLRPRGGSRRGKVKITQEQLNKMSTEQLMDLSAKELGINLGN